MNVCIKTIPHKDHRYETVGDWWFEGKNLHIRISEMGNWRYEMCVAVHELVEALLCKHSKVTQKSVDKFDKMFENEREQRLHSYDEEPGDDPDAPYKVQHCIATGVERIVAALLGVCWRSYEMKINSL